MKSVHHLIIGTKAQFIKMAPIARVLQDEGSAYRILDLSQHGSLTAKILDAFDLRPELVHVLPTGKTVGTYGQMAWWALRACQRLMTPRNKLRKQLVHASAGTALVHGDTFSTLFGLHLARRLGLRVGLVEAGLTSGHLFDPFPEEAVRRHVERHADLLFPPDEASAENLRKRRLRGAIHNTGYNTGRDSLSLIARHGTATGPSPRTVLTLHRAETLARRMRLLQVLSHVQQLAERLQPISFFLHEPTRRALERHGLMAALATDTRFRLKPLADYPTFIQILMGASFILTDGGSIQEEASYLSTPCLVLRSTTERSHGLGTTAALMSEDPRHDLEFLESVERRRRPLVPSNCTLDAAKKVVAAVDGETEATAANPDGT
ncbi:MAG: UDP-N-acetylglucosamine 2-epimerase [Acidobacteria bacterium]|nr:UDP-N-acetylglucosamine 2-epimerase [Acidobacteriota bacterium]